MGYCRFVHPVEKFKIITEIGPEWNSIFKIFQTSVMAEACVLNVRKNFIQTLKYKSYRMTSAL